MRVPIRNWPKEDRPRERLERLGPHALTDAELLAVLIGSGVSKQGSAVDMAWKLLREYGDLGGLDRASIHALKRTTGVGTAKACRIKAALELSRRLSLYKEGDRSLFEATGAASLFQRRAGKLRLEQALVILLDKRNRIIGDRMVALGGIEELLIAPHQVYGPAMDVGAASVALVHGHPSGDPTPSQADLRLTKQLLAAGRVVGVELADHVVVGNGDHFSFKERGLL